MYQFFIAIGLILGVVVDDGSHKRTDTGSFRIPMAIQLVFPMILVPTLLFLAPESPRWLLGKGKVDPAKKALGRLYGKHVDNNKLDEQLSAMQNSVSQEQAQESSWRSIFSWGPEGRKAYLACSMQAWSQASGINFIVSYGVVFFVDVGIDNPYLISTGLYLTTLPGIFISQYGIEKFGRRPMMLLSGSLVAAVLLVMAGCALAPEKTRTLEQTIVAMVFIFLFAFNLAWGPTTWVFTSEIATGPNRGKIFALATATNWLFNWMVSFTFPYLYNPDGANLGSKIGFLYGGLMVLGCVWVYFFLPETARRSLEEIDYMFLHHVAARDFSSFQVPDLSNAEALSADKSLEEKAPYVAVHLDGRV
jgi:MFS transporter, SP family, sugar:H+ symporter